MVVVDHAEAHVVVVAALKVAGVAVACTRAEAANAEVYRVEAVNIVEALPANGPPTVEALPTLEAVSHSVCDSSIRVYLVSLKR